MHQRETSGENSELDGHAVQTIADAVLIARIMKLIDAPKPSPWWKCVLKSPLFSLTFSLVLGFFLTGVVGTYLTYNSNRKQAELEHQRTLNLTEAEHERSFADELNRTRVGKIAEVYEKFYLYEAAVQEAMQGVDVKGDSPRQGEVIVPFGKDLKKALEQSRGTHKELLYVLNKNRAWLEDHNYDKIKEYADFLYEHKFAIQTKQELVKWEEKRGQAMASLTELRERMQKK